MTKKINILIKISIIIFILSIIHNVTINNAYATTEIWSEGTVYRVAPTDNMITVKDYTIKAIDFPAPVRGIRKIDGSIGPDNPVIPFVTFELYKDIINNTNPISQFSIGIGDEYITLDKEMRITIDNIPDGNSQDWVYEYYNPWAEIKIQKRGIPSLDINIIIEDIEEDVIDSGDKFGMVINITNTGEDTMKDIELSLEDPSHTMISSRMTSTLNNLDIDEEKKMFDIDIVTPNSIDAKDYEIYINASWKDYKDFVYYYNTSKTINVRDAFQLLQINKSVAKDSIYIKESDTVILSISNFGNMYMNDIYINDSIPNNVILGNINKDRDTNLITINDSDTNNTNKITEFFLNKSLIGPRESWNFGYNLKPLGPGIYVLPRFNLSFSMLGRKFETQSVGAGFRVFGPKIVLNKTAKRNEQNSEIIDVYVDAKNIGNGFAKFTIDDFLPDGAELISGRLNYTNFIPPGKEDILHYTIRLDKIQEINVSLWPPAKAIYFLDDYKFVTYSNESVPYEGLVWSIEQIEREKVKFTEIVKASKEAEIPTITEPIPEMTETQKMVVATIPANTPITTPKKGIPGFRILDIILDMILAFYFLYFISRKIK